jgi:SNF2 family DNA or RNA helicase
VRTARRKSQSRGDLPPDSAKVRKILELLEEIEEREDRGKPSDEKTIVFSQFTSMLDIIQLFLRSRGMTYVRCEYAFRGFRGPVVYFLDDGSMSKDKREASLNTIKADKHTKIILISFKAGSTGAPLKWLKPGRRFSHRFLGLNLTACNNVILVDMWWNPALEEQAFDRAHRFGQKRDVNIYKLTIEKTVEERILLLQEQKRALAAAALSGDKMKMNKLGMDDLLALFRPGRDDDDDDDDNDNDN